jgi:hypothetical protein
MSTETEIAKIAARIPQIVADHAAAVAAREELIAAETALLDRLIAIVKPAIQAIGDRPCISYATSGGKNNCNPWTEDERAAWRGVCTTDAKPGPARTKRGDDSTGPYEGNDLFLCADGTWCELTYEGTWSIWEGATDSWKATATVLTTATVAREYDVDAIVGRLCQVVIEAGTREKSTAKARARAEQLRALIVLLGASS